MKYIRNSCNFFDDSLVSNETPSYFGGTFGVPYAALDLIPVMTIIALGMVLRGLGIAPI